MQSPEQVSAKRRVLLVVFATVFLDMIGFGIVIPLMPLYVQSMGGSPFEVGLLFSCFSGAQLVATPLLGRLSDRVGRRRVIVLSLAGNAASMIVFALATHVALLPLLFVSRIVAGATAGNLSACQAAIADVTDRTERAAGMGRLGAGIGLGLVLGPVVGGVASRLGPSAPPLVAAAMALCDLALAAFLMPETRARSSTPATVRSRWSGITESLRDALLGPVLGIFFLTFIALTNIQASLGLMAKERLGWGGDEISYLFAMLGAMSLVIQLWLISSLVKALGEERLLIVGGVLIGGGMLMLSAAFSATMMVGAMALFGAGMGVTTPSISSLASRFAPEDRQGEVLGIAQSAGGLARVIGPAWSGILYAGLGARAPFIGGAVAAACSVVVAIYLKAKAAAA
jgi:MFS transporter, DHA1 family, tetracycline resistance protein